MLIYKIKNINNKTCVILHFGVGLVGKAIKNSIFRMAKPDTVYNISFSWTKREEALQQLETIFKKTEYLTRNTSADIYIVWSAGKCGFGASAEETEKEKQFFYAVAGKLNTYAETIKQKVYFYLMSSAGGLYENQNYVDANSRPLPQRPYGFLKLEQENYIRTQKALLVKIFRISTVYSKYLPDGRMGLITVMMNNCIKHKISTIFGSANTLRDYILDEDIGIYIAECIITQADMENIQFLIAGHPSSILEIKKYIELISKKKSYVNYTILKSNASNICFSPNLVAQKFSPSPLYSNLKLLYLNILSNTKSN